MEEPKLENKEEIIKKLKPFWDRYWKLEEYFRKKEAELALEMNKNLKLGINLGFFYVDGECVGIGAEDLLDRDKFPLIPDSVLWSEK